MMAFDTGTAEALAERTREIPQLALLPNDRAAWLLIEGSAAEGVSVVTAWDSIHRHFDAHRAEMILAHARREASAAERELREHPPAPKKRVISYWKKENPPQRENPP